MVANPASFHVSSLPLLKNVTFGCELEKTKITIFSSSRFDVFGRTKLCRVS